MIDCCCIDVEGPTLHEARMVRARKQHTCCECGADINPGDLYEHVKGLWGGHWATYKTCKACRAIRRDLFQCGWIYGELAELLDECHGIRLTDENNQ